MQKQVIILHTTLFSARITTGYSYLQAPRFCDQFETSVSISSVYQLENISQHFFIFLAASFYIEGKSLQSVKSHMGCYKFGEKEKRHKGLNSA